VHHEPQPARSSQELPRGVLFDLDGTLVDTMPGFTELAAEVMMHHHGLPYELARRQYLRTCGIPFCHQLEMIVPGHPANPAAAREFERRKVVASAAALPTPATIATLERLRQAGVRVGISSNNYQTEVDRFAERARVRLDLALGFGPALAKGEPHFRLACTWFGCARSELLFVGDSLTDASLAEAAGVPFVAKLGTFTAASFRAAAPWAPLIQSVAGLLSLLALEPA
jgi:phosphoglycolate phosphatase